MGPGRRGNGRRFGNADGKQHRPGACGRDGHHCRRHRANAGRRPRRPVAQRARRQHCPDQHARYQHDGSRRHQHAVDLPARVARRALGVSRLLRHRALGSAADPVDGDQADRGRSRAGQRGLGRERDVRCDQHHHQAPAGNRRHQCGDRHEHGQCRPCRRRLRFCLQDFRRRLRSGCL